VSRNCNCSLNESCEIKIPASDKSFPQTIVVCSPNTGVTGDQFDGVTSGTFANNFNAWFTGTDLAFPDWS